MPATKLWLLAATLALPTTAAAQSQLGNPQPNQQTLPIIQTPQPITQTPINIAPEPPIAAAPTAPTAPTTPEPPPPPGLVQTLSPPDNADNPTQPPPDGTTPADTTTDTTPDTTATPATPAPDTSASTPPPIPNDWNQHQTAQIGILDKVDGSTSVISIPVGGQSTIGDLQVSILACVSRPPTEIPDDATFLSIQPTAASNVDAASLGPIFRGWMIRSLPGATVVGDASETFRIVSCS